MTDAPAYGYIETQYGRVKVVCDGPDKLAFSVGYSRGGENGGLPDDHEQRLTINRKAYFLDWEVTRKDEGNAAAKVYEGGWRTRADRGYYAGLRSSQWGGLESRPTDAATKVWEERILPVLVDFANGPVAVELLRRGKDNYYDNLAKQAANTRDALAEAKDGLRAIEAKIRAQEPLTSREELFVASAGRVASLANGDKQV